MCLLLFNEGFEDDKCQVQINECLNDHCNNGGTCHDLRARFHCQCQVRTTGDTWSEDRDVFCESVWVHSNHCRNTNEQIDNHRQHSYQITPDINFASKRINIGLKKLTHNTRTHKRVFYFDPSPLLINDKGEQTV